MEPRPKAVPICVCLLLAVHAACTGSAVRLDPISGILDAFRSHQIVALGEGLHGNNQAHAFRLALIRDPRFPSVVNDVVVEFGSSRYQAEMDAFIGGTDVPYAELRKAWQDTTNATAIWDRPIYEEFFRAVRDVNASLPVGRRLRVLLGDPPIDWEAVATPDELVRWIGRRGYAVDVIKRDVLSKNRRALVIYGDGHFRRYDRWVGTPRGQTLLNMIEEQGTQAFSIWTNTTVELERLQRDVASWPIPSLTIVRGTRLGRLVFKYFGFPAVAANVLHNPNALQRCRTIAFLAQRVFDASLMWDFHIHIVSRCSGRRSSSCHQRDAVDRAGDVAEVQLQRL